MFNYFDDTINKYQNIQQCGSNQQIFMASHKTNLPVVYTKVQLHFRVKVSSFFLHSQPFTNREQVDRFNSAQQGITYPNFIILQSSYPHPVKKTP